MAAAQVAEVPQEIGQLKALTVLDLHNKKVGPGQARILGAELRLGPGVFPWGQAGPCPHPPRGKNAVGPSS